MKKAAAIPVISVFIIFTAGLLMAQPRIRISEASWDMGNVVQDSRVKKSLTVKNAGDLNLEISFRTSCECLSLKRYSISLKPGESTRISLIYDTAGITGNIAEYLFMDTNDPDRPHVSWLIEGKVEGGKPVSERTSGNAGTAIELKEKEVNIYMFSTPGCQYCLNLKKYIIPDITRRYKIQINLREFYVTKPDHYRRLIKWEKEFSDTNNRLPVLFIGKKVLAGKSEISEGLDSAIREYRPVKIKPELLQGEILEEPVEKLKSLSLLPVIGAGFVDGLNPCAFGAIIFLISYMSLIKKKKKREIFITGLFFAAGVFTAYFLLGIGLSKILYSMRGILFASRILYLIIGAFTLALAVLSMVDYFQIKKIYDGGKGTVMLKLPDPVRWKIFRITEKHLESSHFVYFAFFTGVLVSVLELICTGQIYLPTIIYMLTAGRKAAAISYLIIYCLMFIVPLLIIFLVYYAGLSSEKIDVFGKKNIGLIKILNIIVFLFFSAYMFGFALGLF